MNGRRTTKFRTYASLLLALLATLTPAARVSGAKGGLKKSDAQKLVAAYSLFELNKAAVIVKEITPGETSATVRAGVRVGFRFARATAAGAWRATEMRVGDRQWEDLDLLARAIGADSFTSARTALDAFAAELDALARAKQQRDDEQKRASRSAKNPRDAKQGEKLKHKAAKSDQKGVQSDHKGAAEDQPELVRGALRVKNPESALSAVGNSAVVEAEVEAAFDVVREGGRWRVAAVRIGERKVPDSDALTRALDAEKSKAARADLTALASALEAFRRERGFYVVADSETVLVDFLAPRYIARVLRVDPWHRPYEYKGTRDTYTLRSLGSDGKPDTVDDVMLNR